MKQQAWRREAAAYPVRGEMQPRYADVDVWQHLNNTALISIHGETVQGWLRGVFGAGAWRAGAPLIATQAQATDFLAEAHFPEPLATGCRLLGVDEQGFRLGCALFQHGLSVGLHEARLVAWDNGRPAPLPAAVADVLRAAEARQPPLPAANAAGSPPPVIASLPALADFPWHLALPSRFGDSDSHGQASDTSLARYAEQTRVEFLMHAFGPQRLGAQTGFMVGHVAVQRLIRGRPPAVWQVGCGITRLGDRSIALRSALFGSDGCHAVSDSVLVVIDRAAHRSTALPEAARAMLAPYHLPRPLPN